jgi:hypothetical protein
MRYLGYALLALAFLAAGIGLQSCAEQRCGGPVDYDMVTKRFECAR